MNKPLLSVIGFAALCASSICVAENQPFDFMNNFNAGPYLGLALGVGGMDTPKLLDRVKIAADFTREDIRKGMTGRIFGGYLWGENEFKYGAELGGLMYPDNHYNVFYSSSFVGAIDIDYVYKGYTIDLLAVLKYYLHNFSITGKAGIGYVSQKFESHLTVTSGETISSETKHKFLPELSIGIGYSLGPCEFDLTYTQLFGKKPLDFTETSNLNDLNKNVASVDTLMVGLTYYFNSSEN